MSEADVMAAVDLYAHETWKGVYGAPEAKKARAAVERALALRVTEAKAAMPCYRQFEAGVGPLVDFGAIACMDGDTFLFWPPCPACAAERELERLEAERETAGAP